MYFIGFRNLLKKYCGVTKGSIKAMWTETMLNEMLVYPFSDDIPSSIRHVLAVMKDQLPPLLAHKRLLSAICRDYPVSALLLPNAVEGQDVESTNVMKALRDFNETSFTFDEEGQFHINPQLECLITLRRHFPLMAQLIAQSKWLEVPECFLDLAKDLIACARKYLTLDDPHAAVAEPSAREKLDFEVNSCYAPSLPLRTVPRVYCADVGVTSSSTPHDSQRDEARCTKHSTVQHALTPGIFAIFCPHGICLVLKIMSHYEGPKTAFDIFFHGLKIGEVTIDC
jgi:hypothetical protein